MTTMIERLSRRMADLEKRDPDAHPSSEYKGPVIPDIAWPDDAKIWHQYVWKVRHLIQAMRDPTEAMVEAGDQVCIDIWPLGPPTANSEDGWRAMIDSALSEDKGR